MKIVFGRLGKYNAIALVRIIHPRTEKSLKQSIRKAGRYHSEKKWHIGFKPKNMTVKTMLKTIDKRLSDKNLWKSNGGCRRKRQDYYPLMTTSKGTIYLITTVEPR